MLHIEPKTDVIEVKQTLISEYSLNNATYTMEIECIYVYLAKKAEVVVSLIDADGNLEIHTIVLLSSNLNHDNFVKFFNVKTS